MLSAPGLMMNDREKYSGKDGVRQIAECLFHISQSLRLPQRLYEFILIEIVFHCLLACTVSCWA